MMILALISNFGILLVVAAVLALGFETWQRKEARWKLILCLAFVYLAFFLTEPPISITAVLSKKPVTFEYAFRMLSLGSFMALIAINKAKGGKG